MKSTNLSSTLLSNFPYDCLNTLPFNSITFGFFDNSLNPMMYRYGCGAMYCRMEIYVTFLKNDSLSYSKYQFPIDAD